MEAFQETVRRFFKDLWPAEEKILVFGEGQSDEPPLMLIGEAPGEQETLQHRPFVGKAGKNLDAFLQAVSLRREDIYISNVVKIRPTKVSPRGSISNRPPNREELALFTPFLYDEIRLVSPRLLVTLGNVALQAILGRDAVIGACHGRPHTADLQGTALTVFPLYHPASVIYNRSLLATYEADLQALRAHLDAGNVI